MIYSHCQYKKQCAIYTESKCAMHQTFMQKLHPFPFRSALALTDWPVHQFAPDYNNTLDGLP